jgi:putative NIF3 family GTP cyclohydrolase 1 type 2
VKPLNLRLLGLGGFIGSHKHFGVSRADSVLNLTEAQKTQIQGLHRAFRDAVKALRESRRAGTITAEAYLRQMVTLSTKLKTDVEAVLTVEQKAALAAFRAQKEAAFAAYRAQVTAVRDRVLGLTSAQSAQFDAIITAQLSAREVLVEQFQAGTLTLAQFQAEVVALNAARATALQALLSAEQYEVVQIHDAITARVHGHGFGHGPGVGEKGPRGKGKGHGKGDRG